MTRFVSICALAISASFGCGDDDGGGTTTDAAVSTPDAPVADAAPPDAGPQASVARGKYLVDHVAVCIDCHTPRNQDGSFDMSRYLAGVECFIDIDPGDTNAGCLQTKNLTNHATGLMNRTDQQIKDMFQKGMRPNGEALIPVMPYYVFHNMTDVDADSVVMYLRTVTGVDNTIPAHQAPWAAPSQPAAGLDPNDIPMPGTPDASKMNGRYLAGMAGVCMECHTKRTNPADAASLDTSNLFAGGEAYPAAGFGLPVPPFPDMIYSANITPDNTTGIGGHTPAQIVTILKQGKDINGEGVCPPMPSGPMGQFAGLTDSDATDIANYLLDIPAKTANGVMNGCSITQ